MHAIFSREKSLYTESKFKIFPKCSKYFLNVTAIVENKKRVKTRLFTFLIT